MQNIRLTNLKGKLSSILHAMLPLLAPFFLQAASAGFLMTILPLSVSLGSAIGLFISYLLGPVGFFFSAAAWGTFLAVEYSYLFSDTITILYLSSCALSWWLSTLCSEQYQQRVVDFEEMVTSLFKKNVELEKIAKEASHLLKEERKTTERQIIDLDTHVQDLQKELSSHRHHLSLAWQETSQIREEGERQRKQLQSNIDGMHTQSLYYLQQKQTAEINLEKVRQEMEILKLDRDERQNQFLEEFNILQAKIEGYQKDLKAKEFEISSLSMQLEEFKEEKKQIDYQLEEIKADKALAEETKEQAIYWETLYKQLRSQFDEKTQVLNETRKELFSLENNLLTSQKKEQERSLEEDADQRRLIEHLEILTSECQDLEEQVFFLQDIISSLQEKKTNLKVKKSKADKELVEKLKDAAHISI